MLKYFVLSMTFLLLPLSSHAFPELIRHGYVNCLTCHVSPSGGGALIDYGRTFSGEGLSTWSNKGEESVFHGLIRRDQIPSWLSLGGDVRAAQTHLENDQIKEGRFIWMQADLEAAVKIGKLTLDATGGRFQRRAEEPRFKSRRYFAMYELPHDFFVRVGRFIPVYGINVADHIVSTRQPLRFDQGYETHNVELSWITDTWSAALTGVQGPLELPTADQEKAISGQLAYGFFDTYKVGANVWSGKSDKNERQMAGLHGLLGFAPDFYLLTEADLTWNRSVSTAASTRGFFTYNKLGYEIYQGVHLLTTAEYWQTDMNDPSTTNDRYGIGTQLFPRPHFDIQAIWTKTRTASGPFGDYAWLILHYYL